MEHSIALSSPAPPPGLVMRTSMLATKGYRHIHHHRPQPGRGPENGRLTRGRKPKRQVFTPLELEDAPTSVQSALAKLVRLGLPIDFLLLNAGLVPGRSGCSLAAGVEAAQAPLSGHHQLTVGLLHSTSN